MKSIRIAPAVVLLLSLILLAGCRKPVPDQPTPTPTPTPSAEVTRVELTESRLLLVVGQTHKLTLQLTPADAASKEVTWSSSDDKVATVSGGEVSACVAGRASITAKHTKSGLSATCEVTVSDQASVTDISGVNL